MVQSNRPLRRLIAVGLALLVLAAACSKPKSVDTADGSGDFGDQVVVDDLVGGSSDDVTTTTAAPKKKKAAGPAANTDPSGVVDNNSGGITGGGDDAQARAVGAVIKPQSTKRVKPYYSGVGEDTITLDFSIDAETCGVNVIAAITAAGGALPTQGRFYRAAPDSAEKLEAARRESIATMIRYWNDHAFEAAEYAPEIRKLMGNDPKNQFFGRHLVGNVIDGGSNQCPEKTTAAAKKAANDHHAFAVFTDFDGSANNMAASLNTIPADRRPMHFGTLWLPDQVYSDYAPFSWTQFATGSTIARQYASYVCSKLRGPNAIPKRAPAVTDRTKRKFGLVHTNLREDKILIAELKGYLNKYCGGNIITKEVEYDGTDFGKAQQGNTNLILQLQQAKVTTVLMMSEPVQPLFQIQAASAQRYFPEWVFSSFGYSDSNTVQRLYDQEEMKGSFGITELGVYGGFGFGAGDPFYMYHAYHLKAPDGKPCDPRSDEGMGKGRGADIELYCKAPTPLATWYYTMLPAIGGIFFAGPDLRPQNVSRGLQAYPTTRYGGNGPTSDPRPALVGAGPGKYGFIVDATEWRWHPEYTSPPPESKAEGWVEYPDCMRHFLLWPNKYAPNWEPSGPNFNSWCGAANGYPHVIPSDSKVS